MPFDTSSYWVACAAWCVRAPCSIVWKNSFASDFITSATTGLEGPAGGRLQDTLATARSMPKDTTTRWIRSMSGLVSGRRSRRTAHDQPGLQDDAAYRAVRIADSG